jgi:hypothetical protein
MKLYLNVLALATLTTLAALLGSSPGHTAEPAKAKEAEEKFADLKKRLPEVVTKLVKESEWFAFADAAGVLVLPVVGQPQAEVMLMRRIGPTEAKITILIHFRGDDPKKTVEAALFSIYLRYFEGSWTSTRLEGSWPSAHLADKDSIELARRYQERYIRGAHLLMQAIDLEAENRRQEQDKAKLAAALKKLEVAQDAADREAIIKAAEQKAAHERAARLQEEKRKKSPEYREEQAGRLLGMAKAYHRYGNPEKARLRLREILQDYPETPTAKRAKELLQKWDKDK